MCGLCSSFLEALAVEDTLSQLCSELQVITVQTPSLNRWQHLLCRTKLVLRVTQHASHPSHNFPKREKAYSCVVTGDGPDHKSAYQRKGLRGFCGTKRLSEAMMGKRLGNETNSTCCFERVQGTSGSEMAALPLYVGGDYRCQKVMQRTLLALK